MDSRLFLVLAITCWLTPLTQAVTGQESQWTAPKPAAKKVVIDPPAKTKEETRGEARFGEYEIAWPSIKTHPRSFLKVSNQSVSWKQEFLDGDAPFFNAFEEKFEPGVYTFRVEYVTDEQRNAKQATKAAFGDRRALLRKRLELLEKGDRDGAKAALDRANQIRAEQAEQAKQSQLSPMQMVARSRNSNIIRTGTFEVDDDGKVKIYKGRAERNNDRSNNNSSSADEISDEEV